MSQEELNEQLFEALDDLDYDRAKKLIEQGADVNARDGAPDFVTPIMIVAGLEEAPEFLKYLIEKGADVNAKDRLGRTALMFASEVSLKNVVVLVENGADVNATTGERRDKYSGTVEMSASALDFALERNNYEIAKYLLSKGANINNKMGTKQVTPLLRAVAKGDLKDVKFLLNNGANIEAKDVDGATALFYAISYRNLLMTTLLLEHNANMEGCLNNGVKFLEFAKMIRGGEEVLNYLNIIKEMQKAYEKKT